MHMSSVDLILFVTNWKPSTVLIPLVKITMRNFASSLLVNDVHFVFAKTEV